MQQFPKNGEGSACDFAKANLAVIDGFQNHGQALANAVTGTGRVEMLGDSLRADPKNDTYFPSSLALAEPIDALSLAGRKP